MRRDRERYDAALAGSDVRNGIVACWVLLEETAAEVGVTTPARPRPPPSSWCASCTRSTSTRARSARLAGLYHEARFSTHPLPADARSRAEQALAGIHADLDRSAAT